MLPEFRVGTIASLPSAGFFQQHTFAHRESKFLVDGPGIRDVVPFLELFIPRDLYTDGVTYDCVVDAR